MVSYTCGCSSNRIKTQNRATGVPSSPPLFTTFSYYLSYNLSQQQLLRTETTSAAGTADTERAAVANDVGATVGDRSQVPTAQRGGRESRFRCCEGAGDCASMNRGAPGEHTRNDRESRLVSQCSAVGAACARAGCASERVDKLHNYRVRTNAGQCVADQIVVYRQGNQAVRRDQARAAGNQLFIRRERINVHADVASGSAEARAVQ